MFIFQNFDTLPKAGTTTTKNADAILLSLKASNGTTTNTTSKNITVHGKNPLGNDEAIVLNLADNDLAKKLNSTWKYFGVKDDEINSMFLQLNTWMLQQLSLQQNKSLSLMDAQQNLSFWIMENKLADMSTDNAAREKDRTDNIAKAITGSVLLAEANETVGGSGGTDEKTKDKLKALFSGKSSEDGGSGVHS
jgi:hypothetical protein